MTEDVMLQCVCVFYMEERKCFFFNKEEKKRMMKDDIYLVVNQNKDKNIIPLPFGLDEEGRIKLSDRNVEREK